MRRMRPSPRRFTLAALLACLLLAACPQQAAQLTGRGAQVETPPDTLTLAYIGNLRGFQRPCG
jgi:hypothetical protein